MHKVNEGETGKQGANSTNAFRCGYCGDFNCPAAINHKPCPKDKGPEPRSHYYDPRDFKRFAIYTDSESYDGESMIEPGQVIKPSAKIQQWLKTVEDTNWLEGDKSKQDFAVISAMLSERLTPQDVLATFLASPRGADARKRKSGHVDDYLQRTLAKAVARVEKDEFTVEIIDSSQRANEAAEPAGALRTQTLENIEQTEVKWMGRGIPFGYMTVLAGEEGVGKSTITCHIVGKITRKGDEVLLISDEDNEADTLVPRLNVAGADLSKVHHMHEVAWKDDNGGYAFEILRDIAKLEHWLATHPKVKLVVIDPWINYIGRKNNYNTQEVRQVFMPLQGLARKFGIVMLCLAHFKKGQAGRANEKIGGAAAVVQVPRSVLLVLQVQTGKYEMHQTKHSLNPQHKGKTYEIVEAVSKLKGQRDVKAPKIKWTGDSNADAEARFAAKDPHERELDLCCEWLREFLDDAEIPATEVIKAGKMKGFSERTMFRARSLVATTRKDAGQNGRAFWALP